MFYEIDLNGDGRKEIFVGLGGTYFCGSGGCTVLLLDNNGSKISSFSVVDYPIVVANTSTKGWRDLIINSRGSKDNPHIVKWDGKKYPGNPSIQPKYMGQPIHDDVHGTGHRNQSFPVVPVLTK